MRWSILVVAVAAACGRIGFDPPGADDDNAAGDASPLPNDGSGNSTGDGPPGMIDAPSFCQSAISVGVGRTAALDTCSGEDRLDSCSTNKRELVFEFIPPVTGLYTVSARDPGTANVTNSTARLNSTCTARQGGCAGVLGTTFTGGQPVYFTVEASQGACAMIELEIIAS